MRFPLISLPEKAWLPVFGLAFAAFIFNTTEFVPVGLLPSIASSFSMDVAHTGILMTGYAWAVTILSLPLTLLTARWERRKLLLVLFVLFISSHILSGIAWNFTTLMISRIGIACAHAVFWAIATPLVVRIAPNGKGAKAMSFMVTGSSLATVLGVPIGTIIGQYTGWRTTFLCIAVVAFIVMVILLRLLPRLESSNAGSLKSVPLLLQRPALVHIYVLIALLVTAYFTAYTYISPFMSTVGGFSDHAIVFLLLVFGGAGILAGIVFSKYSARYPVALLITPIVFMLLSLLFLHLSAFNTFSTVVVCLLLGLSITLISLCLQSKVLSVASDASDVAIAMFSGIFNIGIGGGALVGSKVLLYMQVGDVGYVGALFALAALLLCVFFSRRYWTL